MKSPNSQAQLIKYNGPSMNPTLRGPSILEVYPYPTGQPPAPGDVLFFYNANGEGVVHRLVYFTPRGLKTRGDNNPGEDPNWLTAESVVGQVRFEYRGQHRHRVDSGRVGLLYARLIWLWRRIQIPLVKCFAWPMRSIAALTSTCLGQRLPQSWQAVEMLVHLPDGNHRRLVWRGRMIGEFDPSSARWFVRWPYRLFFDRQSPPDG